MRRYAHLTSFRYASRVVSFALSKKTDLITKLLHNMSHLLSSFGTETEQAYRQEKEKTSNEKSNVPYSHYPELYSLEFPDHVALKSQRLKNLYVT